MIEEQVKYYIRKKSEKAGKNNQKE